jgi:hypothetical protein
MGQLVQALGNGYSYANPGQGGGGNGGGAGNTQGLLGSLLGKSNNQQQAPLLNSQYIPTMPTSGTGTTSMPTLQNPTVQNSKSAANSFLMNYPAFAGSAAIM